ncbi:hypothetical protein ACFQ05_04470 [Amycolatopsis umgeniensis]|uniref:Uncharacterized protein n=1 Tax=Amycolatopsis umgeniensis TaxID=336628 RepID=A0A841B0U2_9PSEU|nr:hypothetical protein [Amycolatopsis umgeniensis]MBB5852521.1 hypothetical protein [Amycolatopsis umgeniensis]
MAKNSGFPGLKTGGVVDKLKKLILAAVVVTVIVMVLKSPAEAADVVTDGRDSGEDAIDSLITFFRSLRNG